MTPMLSVMSFSFSMRFVSQPWSGLAFALRPAKVLVDVLLDFLAHEATRVVGAFLPGEHAGGDDAVKADRSEASEERVPVHLALADIHVLVDRHLGARRVADIAQPRRGLVV